MKTLLTLSIFIFLVVLLPSCASSPKAPAAVDEPPLLDIASVAVLPVQAAVSDSGAGAGQGDSNQLQSGAVYADSVIIRELTDKQKVTLITPSQLSGIEAGASGGAAATIAAVGRDLDTDAVLITTLYKFDKRQGGEYAVDAPASASFDMQLIDTKTGAIIWTADFNETQQSLLSNLLSFGKAQNRGFKWITVEQLLAQGIRERLAACPYL